MGARNRDFRQSSSALRFAYMALDIARNSAGTPAHPAPSALQSSHIAELPCATVQPAEFWKERAPRHAVQPLHASHRRRSQHHVSLTPILSKFSA